MTVESHSCAKDAQEWGTRLLLVGLTSTDSRSLEAPLFFQALGEEDQR
jgi:hypothetical protein